MGHKTSIDMAMQIDDATGSLVAITGSVNSQALSAAMSVLEDSGMGDEERTYLPGLAGATIDLSGFLDTTTDGIFGPLVGNRTSKTKTVQFTPYAGRFYTGECYPTSVGLSGSPDTLETWSASLTFDGAVSRTTKALT
jgi:hypothetical protein